MIDETRKAVVLVTCDDDDMRQICRTCLEHTGYLVQVAEDPDLALALALATLPDIIVTSFPTYTSDGVTVTTRLREEALFAETPMLSLASWTRREDLAAASAAGVTESLPVPVELQTLIETVDRLTSGTAHAGRARFDAPHDAPVAPPNGVERRHRASGG